MQTTQPPIETKPFDNRQPTDIDLISAVRDLLNESGLQQEVINNFDTSIYIQDALQMNPDGQRFLLNRFWNLQLLIVNAVTVEERFCLISTGEFNDWLRLFTAKILPCAITHRLPTSLNQF